MPFGGGGGQVLAGKRRVVEAPVSGCRGSCRSSPLAVTVRLVIDGSPSVGPMSDAERAGTSVASPVEAAVEQDLEGLADRPVPSRRSRSVHRCTTTA